jgi:hypothetical protein
MKGFRGGRAVSARGMEKAFLSVLLSVFLLFSFTGCGSVPASQLKAVKAAEAFPVTYNHKEASGTGLGYFTFQVKNLLPVQDEGAFNAFLFPDLPSDFRLVYAQGYLVNAENSIGSIIPYTYHRGGFDTTGNAVDILVVNPTVSNKIYQVWITTNDERIYSMEGEVTVYYRQVNQ